MMPLKIIIDILQKGERPIYLAMSYYFPEGKNLSKTTKQNSVLKIFLVFPINLPVITIFIFIVSQQSLAQFSSYQNALEQ